MPLGDRMSPTRRLTKTNHGQGVDKRYDARSHTTARPHEQKPQTFGAFPTTLSVATQRVNTSGLEASDVAAIWRISSVPRYI